MLIKKNILFFILLVLASTTLYGISILNITQNADTIQQFEKYEVTFDLATTYSNPYNPGIIDVSAVFTSPNQTIQTNNQSDLQLNACRGRSQK